MPKKRKVAYLTILLFLISIFLAVDGFALVLKQTTEELTFKSDRIITGEVTEVKSEWDEGKTTINTYVTVLVDQHIKGSQDKVKVTIRIPGGTVGDTTIKVSDVAQFKLGEKVLVFLESEGPDLFRVRGWFQGKHTIKNGKIVEKNVSVGKFIKEIQGILKREKSNFNGSFLPMTAPETKTKEKKGLLLPLQKQPGQMRLKDSLSKEIIRRGDFRSSVDTESSIITKAAGWQDIINENFEGVFPSGSWNLYGNPTWGKDDFKPHNGFYSAWCARSGTNGLDPESNNYPNYCESWAVYGPFDLSDATDLDISVWFWLQSELYYDGLFLGISTDGELFDGIAYTGDSEGWYNETFSDVDLSVYLGEPTVWIAAVFLSDDIITYKGAFIDDVLVRKDIPPSPPLINNISPTSGSAGTGTSVTIYGSNFGNVQGSNTVTFFFASGYPRIEAEVTSWSDTAIACIVPMGASSGEVKVTTPDGTSNGVQFTVTFGYAGIKWYDTDIPVSYYINESGTPDCASEFTATQDAFQTWEDVEGSYMDFTYRGTTPITGDNHNDGNNVVSWGSVPPGAIAVTWIRYSGDRVAETDMIFNNTLPWSNSGEAGKYDVQNIGTHEAGHFLVLDDLYGTADSEKTMYGFGATGETKKRTLEPDDISGIIYIYPGCKLPMVTGDLDNNGQDEIIIDFGNPYGIWIKYNNLSWSQLHNISPQSMVIGDLDSDPKDDIIIDFGDPYGIWIYYNNSTWVQLHNLNPEFMVTGNLDNTGQDEIIIDFGNPYGIWAYYNNSTWVQLHSISPEFIFTADLDTDPKDDLIIDFGKDYGIWIYYNNSSWQKLHDINPEFMVTGNLDADSNDDIIIDFGDPYGIWIYYNNSTWAKLHNLSPEFMVLGDINNTGQEDIIVDFGEGYGIWIYYDNSTWVQLHNLSPEFMVTGDLDGTDGDDIVIDFGDPYGIWIYYNNSGWNKLHDLSP